MTTRPTPVLVLDQVERDPDVPTRLVGRVRVGGHRVRVVLDFARPDLVEYVEVPWLLDLHHPSLQAVMSTLSRIDAGEEVPLPFDLSADVRDTDPPNPWLPLDHEAQQQLDTAADQVDLEIEDVERDASDSTKVIVRLIIDGRPVLLDAELYGGNDAVPVVRWIGGADPAGFTPAQRYAIERALLR
jgi:hypothetical protein